MSDIQYVISKNNGQILQQNGNLTADIWVPCDKDGNPLGAKTELTELDLLKQEAKELGVRGWNNAKRPTLIQLIARKKEEIKLQAEEEAKQEFKNKLTAIQEKDKIKDSKK